MAVPCICWYMCVWKEKTLHFRTVKKCLHDVFGQRHKISALQRAKALRSALVLWYVKVEGGDIYSN